MTPPLSSLAKSVRSPRTSVTSCDIVVAWAPSQVHKKKPWKCIICLPFQSRGRVIFCAPGSGPTLQQCHKTSRIFAENEQILRVATEVASFFIGLFSKEKDLWLFGRAPSASQKALPKSQKGPFSRKRTVKMMPPPTLGKSARSRECP